VAISLESVEKLYDRSLLDLVFEAAIFDAFRTKFFYRADSRE